MSNSIFAAHYICKGGIDDPIVKIVEVNGHPEFQYIVDNKVEVSMVMDKGIIHSVTDSPIGFEAGQSFIFRPPYGETIVHIYGRILPRGAVFDIFVLGILGNVQRTLVDYECRVKN
jgi:hypothetical protein